MEIDLEKTKPLTPEEEEREKLKGLIESAKADKREAEKVARFWRKLAERREQELEVALAIKKEQKPIIITPQRGKTVSETMPVLVGCDWHAEETVEARAVDGLNEFNLDVADRRIERFFQRGLKLIDIWRRDTKIDELTLAFLGDLINGYIHEEYLESNALSPVETVNWLQPIIIGGIEFLLNNGKFKKIHVPCVYGNHGRTTQKIRIKTGYKNSFEWLMYNNLAHLARHFAGTCVEFNIARGELLYATVYGRDIRFHHGQEFRYSGGIGGISIPANKAVKEWNDARRAYLDIFAHWHQYLDGRMWLSCGCLIGYDEFAQHIKAPFQPPTQTLVFIEKNMGKTGVHQIYLD